MLKTDNSNKHMEGHSNNQIDPNPTINNNFDLKKYLKRILGLLFGLFLYSLGIVLTLKANIGYAPWEVLHVGLSRTTGMSIGVASILVGLLIGLVVWLMKESLGLGTLLNMILIGIFIDILILLDFIPKMNQFPQGLLLMVIGLFVISFGSYFYIGSGFGAGPRDSLMVVLTRKTGLPVGVCRGGIELTAVFVGWLLGGMVGIGTVIAAFGIGLCVQITFKILKFDPTTVKHETLRQTISTVFFNRSQDYKNEIH